MKPQRSLALVIILAACPASFTDEPPEKHRGEGRVYEKEAKISFLPPKDWEQLKDEEGARFFAGRFARLGTMNVGCRSAVSPSKMAPDIRKTPLASKVGTA